MVDQRFFIPLAADAASYSHDEVASCDWTNSIDPHPEGLIEGSCFAVAAWLVRREASGTTQIGVQPFWKLRIGTEKNNAMPALSDLIVIEKGSDVLAPPAGKTSR